MACFYVFVENTVPMAIGRTSGLSERLRNALANTFPYQKLNIFPAFFLLISFSQFIASLRVKYLSVYFTSQSFAVLVYLDLPLLWRFILSSKS